MDIGRYVCNLLLKKLHKLKGSEKMIELEENKHKLLELKSKVESIGESL